MAGIYNRCLEMETICLQRLVWSEQKNKGLLGENYEKNPEASDKIFDETFKQVEQFKENEDGER